MATTSRFGTGLLGTFGLALAVLMAYTLAYEGCAGPESPELIRTDSTEVAVFFPDRPDWLDFRKAVGQTARRGLCRASGESNDSVVVETLRKGRRVRFTWHGTRGVGQTRDEVERSAQEIPAPVAVIGSSTTVLTLALAEPLRDQGPGGPVLLIPWASTIRTGGPGSVPLLEIDRGRTFRFCPNNQRLAESVVDGLMDQDDKVIPEKVYLVVDEHDPYSVDLADCFRRVIGDRAPSAEVIERTEAVGVPTVSRSPGAIPSPSAEESALAAEIWSAADVASKERTTWVVLPLQGDPTRRMLAALQSRSSWQTAWTGDGPLRVITGDGIGRDSLEGQVGRRSFPIWSALNSSVVSPSLGVDHDTQTFAEIVAAILLATEESSRPVPTSDDLRDALLKLDLAETDPSAFGRPLRFTRDGERKDDPGSVLAVRPGRPEVSEFSRDRNGRWTPVEAAGSEARP